MPLAISSPNVIMPSPAPGSTANFTVDVTGAVQPDTAAIGSISVDFNGETATAPVNVTFQGLVSPSITVTSLDSRLEIAFDEPTRIAGNSWRFSGTITVV